MKIVASIEPEWNEDGSSKDINYLGGKLVALTTKELAILKELQNAITGQSERWFFPGRDLLPNDDDMSPVFLCIYNWVKVKFTVNSLQSLVNELNEQLNVLEGDNEL